MSQLRDAIIEVMKRRLDWDELDGLCNAEGVADEILELFKQEREGIYDGHD